MKQNPTKLLDINAFEKALDEYYHFRGWDNNGVPTEGKLKELNLI